MLLFSQGQLHLEREELDNLSLLETAPCLRECIGEDNFQEDVYPPLVRCGSF